MGRRGCLRFVTDEFGIMHHAHPPTEKSHLLAKGRKRVKLEERPGRFGPGDGRAHRRVGLQEAVTAPGGDLTATAPTALRDLS